MRVYETQRARGVATLQHVGCSWLGTQIRQSCHGGRHLNTTIHTTTKSYIISYLISYMILLGFHWKLCMVWVIGVWGWWYGLVMVSRDWHYRRDTIFWFRLKSYVSLNTCAIYFGQGLQATKDGASLGLLRFEWLLRTLYHWTTTLVWISTSYCERYR